MNNSPEYHRARKAAWYAATRDHNLKRMANWRERLRTAVLDKMGGKCTCCGESCYSMLEIDHVNNDGTEHRKLRANNYGLYRDIINDECRYAVRLLCRNCNTSRARITGGGCEHDRAVDAVMATAP